MPLFAHSIRNRITFLAVIIASCIFALSMLVGTLDSRDAALNAAQNNARLLAEREAARLEGELKQAFSSAHTLAWVLQGMKEGGQTPSREQIDLAMREMLKQPRPEPAKWEKRCLSLSHRRDDRGRRDARK